MMRFWMAAIMAASAAVLVQADPAPGAYQLDVRLPSVFRKSQAASLILSVRQDGRPVEDASACLDPVPLFEGDEDANDPTPALGADLGVASGPATVTTCVMAIAAVRVAPGVYRFTWEPDTAGRVRLRFTVSDSSLDVPVDVASAPPSLTVLLAFVIFTAATLTVASRMRRARRREGPA